MNAVGAVLPSTAGVLILSSGSGGVGITLPVGETMTAEEVSIWVTRSLSELGKKHTSRGGDVKFDIVFDEPKIKTFSMRWKNFIKSFTRLTQSVNVSWETILFVFAVIALWANNPKENTTQNRTRPQSTTQQRSSTMRSEHGREAALRRTLVRLSPLSAHNLMSKKVVLLFLLPKSAFANKIVLDDPLFKDPRLSHAYITEVCLIYNFLLIVLKTS